MPETQPEMLRVWDGIKVDQRERTVNITVAIPQALLDKLVDMLGTGPGLQRLTRPVTLRRPTASSVPESHRPK